MNLGEALDMILECGEEEVVFAKRPWTLDSDATIGLLDEKLATPSQVRSAGYDYFLDVITAREVLGVFRGITPSRDQARGLLLYYGEFDAYPDWVYELNGEGVPPWPDEGS